MNWLERAFWLCILLVLYAVLSAPCSAMTPPSPAETANGYHYVSHPAGISIQSDGNQTASCHATRTAINCEVQ